MNKQTKETLNSLLPLSKLLRSKAVRFNLDGEESLLVQVLLNKLETFVKELDSGTLAVEQVDSPSDNDETK